MSSSAAEPQIVPATRRGTRSGVSMFRTRGGQLLRLIGSGCLAIGIWYGILLLFDLPHYVLPTPQGVMQHLWHGLVAAPIEHGFFARQGFYQPAWDTIRVFGLGFLLGCASALVVALLMAWFKLFDDLVFPLVTGIQSMPKIALAPLFVLWFGFGAQSRVMLASVLAFFPMLVNTRAGLLNIDEDRMMMARSFSATRWRIVRRISVPSAMPYIATGLELAVVYALLGAIVAEFMAGSEGLGVRLLQFQYNQAVGAMFAVLILMAAIGITLNRLVGLIRKKLVFWN